MRPLQVLPEQDAFLKVPKADLKPNAPMLPPPSSGRQLLQPFGQPVEKRNKPNCKNPDPYRSEHVPDLPQPDPSSPYFFPSINYLFELEETTI